MRVVIAEDVMITRQGLVGLLEEAGVDVVGETQDADELLRKVSATHPDAAIVDIRMPPPTPTKASSPPRRSAHSTPTSLS